MNTPEELGRNYAATTYTLLKETDDIRFRTWDEGPPAEQLDNVNGEIRRQLAVAHERAKAADICLREHALTIADLSPDSQADALRAMYTQFDRTLRADLADTIRRYRDRYPGCNHTCDEHRPYGLSTDADIQPVSAQGIRKIHAWLRQRKPKYIGGHLEFEISGGVWVVNSIAGELDDNPHPDEAAVTTAGSRQSVAEAIVYIENTLVQLEGGGKVIATYDGTPAVKALKGFRVRIVKEFEERIHESKHRLATDPLEPCDYPTCHTRRNDPWS